MTLNAGDICEVFDYSSVVVVWYFNQYDQKGNPLFVPNLRLVGEPFRGLTWKNYRVVERANKKCNCKGECK